MSQKITGKNLQYDQTLPPFLARLKGQHIADSESPDPILASRRRAAKPRSASEEAEDAPLIVDDDGNVVQGMKKRKAGKVVGADAEDEEEGDSVAKYKAATQGKGALAKLWLDKFRRRFVTFPHGTRRTVLGKDGEDDDLESNMATWSTLGLFITAQCPALAAQRLAPRATALIRRSELHNSYGSSIRQRPNKGGGLPYHNTDAGQAVVDKKDSTSIQLPYKAILQGQPSSLACGISQVPPRSLISIVL
ncbi:hypothetical protein VP1G_09459 [Cytospora mali]|uniref:DUF4604 domain-containing protein n=1 Tax=Cytospora mali TaxID=578113 RepID=A0A194VEM0_CYTMA|nr:hypothetical protein VP1G_09459 [Valsa mali var. pyri (nom. inval.)]